MVHQPSGGARGQATDIQIQAEEIIKLKKQLNGLYVKHTNQPLDYIDQSMERDKVSSGKLTTGIPNWKFPRKNFGGKLPSLRMILLFNFSLWTRRKQKSLA